MSKTEPPTLVEKFHEDIAKVNTERSAAYGHPDDDFGNVAAITVITNKCRDPHMRHVLYAIAIKMCRLIFNPTHYDSWLDIAGYAKTAIMILDRRVERERSAGKTGSGSVQGADCGIGSINSRASEPPNGGIR